LFFQHSVWHYHPSRADLVRRFLHQFSSVQFCGTCCSLAAFDVPLVFNGRVSQTAI
jgi:hypothetical protein